MRDYYIHKRINDLAYLIHHAKKLLEFARDNEDSSLLIYACLDSRIALEMCDLQLILAAAKPTERDEILESSKPKNGIDKLNNKRKTLKEKYHIFFQTLSELLDIQWHKYNFKESKELQNRLSTYIHSYYMKEDEIDFQSETMQAVFPLIQEVRSFIQESLNFDGENYHFIGIVMESMHNEEKVLLNEWKDSNMTLEELKEKLSAFIENRKINK